jgi:ubiquitin-protein ligase E3 C
VGKEIDLVPGGSKLDVTNKNKLRYIHLVAKHHMSDRIKSQSLAFGLGLHEVIPKEWLQIFNEQELQVLISGASGGRVDVGDMKRNARYQGGYSSIDVNIIRFWRVVESFDVKEQALLLKFTTSCERPPPLGFQAMNPGFTVMRVGISSDNEKLPSASTCFNVLKLPTYSSEKVLREKLLLSISSGSGFEMS